jgi:glyoxylase-like metal-dependent hydrolase (beta-lactamase superfamily II)
MLEWSAAFGGVPVYLHADDRQWVMRDGAEIVYWTGETLSLNPEMTLIRCGGHFPGGQVLHWSAAENGKGALFAGDIAMVAQDRRHVSFMYSFPNYIPLNATAVKRIAAAVAPFPFDAIYGAWTSRNIASGGREAFDVSVRRYLEAIAG